MKTNFNITPQPSELYSQSAQTNTNINNSSLGRMNNASSRSEQRIESSSLKSCLRQPNSAEKRANVSFSPNSCMVLFEKNSHYKDHFYDKRMLNNRVKFDLILVQNYFINKGINGDGYNKHSTQLNELAHRETGINPRGLEKYLFNNLNDYQQRVNLVKNSTLQEPNKLVTENKALSFFNSLRQDIANNKGLQDQMVAQGAYRN